MGNLLLELDCSLLRFDCQFEAVGLQKLDLAQEGISLSEGNPRVKIAGILGKQLRLNLEHLVDLLDRFVRLTLLEEKLGDVPKDQPQGLSCRPAIAAGSLATRDTSRS